MTKKKKIVLTITIIGYPAAVYKAFAELFSDVQYENIPVIIEKVSGADYENSSDAK